MGLVCTIPDKTAGIDCERTFCENSEKNNKGATARPLARIRPRNSLRNDGASFVDAVLPRRFAPSDTTTHPDEARDHMILYILFN